MNRDRARNGQRHRFGVVGVIIAALAVAALAGCGSSGGGSSEGSGGAATVKPGGTLKVGMQPGNGQFDPVLMAGSIGDILLQAQSLEGLVEFTPDFKVGPVLATEWKPANGGKVWEFTLRDGVTFSNGEKFTAADVVYSFDRLRDKEIGSPMAAEYAEVHSVVANDPMHVTFTLKSANAEFPAKLTDYRSKILCRTVKNPMKQLVGTGPFVISSFAAEDRAVLKKNPNYWGTAPSGEKLPYLDQVEFVYSPDTAGQIEGLQGGTLNWVGGLSAPQKATVESSTNLKTVATKTNYCFEMQIRCDDGPGRELAFRQALMAGTNRQAIVDIVAKGVGEPGNGTLVGPAYTSYYSAQQVAYDPERAKKLLADAGFANGVKIKLVAQSSDPVPAIATAWQAQMKAIGVTVDIQKVPVDVYYAEKGENNWYNAHFSFVDYGTRAAPITYFNLALTSDAQWNYSKWHNKEFDAIAKKIPQTLDEGERAQLYKQAQTILQTEVPMINFIINTAVAGQSKNVDGIALAPDYVMTSFRSAHFTE